MWRSGARIPRSGFQDHTKVKHGYNDNSQADPPIVRQPFLNPYAEFTQQMQCVEWNKNRPSMKKNNMLNNL